MSKQQSSGPPGTPEPDTEKARSTIVRLSELLDPVGLYTHIIEESKYGKRKHPNGDPWGYTRDGLRLYAPDTDPDEVIRIFKEVGAHDDHATARWLLKHESMIP